MAPSRVRPAFRLAVMFACILLLPLAVHAVWDYVEARRLSRVVEAIRARGERVHFGTYREDRPVTPEQEQASRYYGAAAILARQASGKPADEVAATIDTLAQEPADAARHDPRLANLLGVEREYSPALDLIDRASRLDARGLDYGHETRYGFPELGLSTVNGARIARLAFEGDGDGAARALMATLRMRRAFRDQLVLSRPVRTEQSVRLILSFSVPSTALLESLQQEFNRWDDDDAIARGLIESRARLIEALWPGAYGELPTLPRLRVPRVYPGAALGYFLFRPYYTHQVVGVLGSYDRAIVASRLRWPDRLRAASTRLNDLYRFEQRLRLSAVSRWDQVTALAGYSPLPVADRVDDEFRRIAGSAALDLARRRSQEGVLAIERWRRAHGGRLPSSIDELVPSYVAALVDPFSGRSLRYAQTSSSYKVYSIGPDEQDNGGDFTRGGNGALVPAIEVSRDIGLEIRVPR